VAVYNKISLFISGQSRHVPVNPLLTETQVYYKGEYRTLVRRIKRKRLTHPAMYRNSVLPTIKGPLKSHSAYKPDTESLYAIEPFTHCCLPVYSIWSCNLCRSERYGQRLLVNDAHKIWLTRKNIYCTSAIRQYRISSCLVRRFSILKLINKECQFYIYVYSPLRRTYKNIK